jgi:FMN-dependent NADH-azoreductase
MSTIFRLDSSIRHDGSVTRAVSDTLVDTITAELDDVTVVRRDLLTEPVSPQTWSSAAFAGYTPEDQRSPEQVAAQAEATRLADEVLGADVLVFGTPMYNFGVSAHFKTWFDLVLTDPRLGPGSTALQGKPAFLVVARGGGYGPGTPREGWDQAIGWLRLVLGEVWGLDLDVIETELTLAEVTPAMAELVDLAREQLAESHDSARRNGRSVTLRLGAAA